jgi:hypothetical protein
MSEVLQVRLSLILEKIDWGLIGFERVGREWRPIYSETPSQRPKTQRMGVVFLTLPLKNVVLSRV